ncbi:MAG: DUF3419 family protein [Simkania sp.]|nr:DUF3419 family protein [Simkania sp.]
MAQILSRLSYSLGNEDCRTEHEALNIQSGDRAVCITMSGDRPLHLLLADVKEVVAIDANPHQNHLLELKKVALQELPYDQYAGFLGVTSMERRDEVWGKIYDKVPETSRSYWDRRFKMIERGVLYQGNVEKWCGRLSKIMGVVRGKKVDKLFQCRDLEEQIGFLDEWETKTFKRMFQYVLHPMMTRLFIRDPGLYKHLGEGISPGEYIYGRFHGYLRRHLAKDSPLISLVLLGQVTRDNIPPYLSRLGAALIRSRLNRISHESADILTYLKAQPDASFDVFSLSNIASYMDAKKFKELVREVVRTAKPGARCCFRQFMSLQEIPEEWTSSFRRNKDLEKKLEEADRCFVYRFMVGNIVK